MDALAADISLILRRVAVRFFFFQAEDGIRDVAVTGVQTCALPILASNLTNQVRNIAEVTTAVAKGDLSKEITVEAKGEILELKNTINTMVDQLNEIGRASCRERV